MASDDEDVRGVAPSHRRRFLQGVGATGIAGVLAGCLGGDDGDENGGENGTGNGDDENGTENGDDEPAFFAVSDLAPGDDDVTRGDEVEVTATVENTGDEEGTQTVELVFDGESEASEEVTLTGGETSDVFLGEIATADRDTGDYEYSVSTDDDDASATLSVGGAFGDDPDSLVSLDESTVGVGEQTLSATLDNPYAVALEDGAVELEAPDGWELSNPDGTSFDTLDALDSQAASWELTVPDDAEGDYELTANVSYSSADEDADVTTGLSVTVDLWQGLEFTEVLHFEDLWENGIDDRRSENLEGETDEGQSTSTLYKYALDLSAVSANRVQFYIEDPYTDDGWGPSVWDAKVRADGEEHAYFRTVHDDTEEDYLVENQAAVDDFSEENQNWRFADGNANSHLIYEFDLPEDAEDVVVEFTMRNALLISARTLPENDISKDNVSATKTPAVRVPYTGGGVQETTQFSLAPGYELPHGATFTYENEDLEGELTYEDVLANWSFGYDENTLYFQAEVLNENHSSVAGENMWQADSVQFAAGTGDEYGPEYGIAHVDGEADVYQWMEGQAEAGVDAIDAETSRDDEAGVTTYVAAVPWEALYAESKGEAGDNGPFSVTVNVDVDGDGERDVVLGWTLPGINVEKAVDDLGTLLLERPVGDAVPEPDFPAEGLVGQYDASALGLGDGDAVASWPDAGGDGLELTQDDEGAQPTFHEDVTNGNPAVRFEGDSDFINADEVATEDTAGVTMAVAFSALDVSNPRQAVVFNGDDGSLNGYGIFVNDDSGNDVPVDGSVHALYGGVNWWYSETAAVEEQFHVATLTIPEDAPDEPILRLDGEVLGSELQQDASPPETPSTQFGIGQDGSDQDDPPYFDGDVGEVVVYDRELSSDEREDLEGYLAEKWSG